MAFLLWNSIVSVDELQQLKMLCVPSTNDDLGTIIMTGNSLFMN